MKVDAYLGRIGYSGSREVNQDALVRLHRSHMFAVPFENLDIAMGRRIVLSLESLFDKIVRRRRGGFCYELNGLFAWLLERLGFSVTMLSARVWDGGRPGPEFDHMTLLIEVEGHSLLADVGFGDSFLEPLQLDGSEAAGPQASAYRVTGSHPELMLERRTRDEAWQPQYLFSLTPRRLADFDAMCEYHQTSPSSHFTRNSICSLATPSGRLTLSGRRAIETTAFGRSERTVEGEEEYRALLADWFHVELPDE